MATMRYLDDLHNTAAGEKNSKDKRTKSTDKALTPMWENALPPIPDKCALLSLISLLLPSSSLLRSWASA